MENILHYAKAEAFITDSGRSMEGETDLDVTIKCDGCADWRTNSKL